MGLSADEETTVDIDVNIGDNVPCAGMSFVGEPDEVCDRPAAWRRIRHCTSRMSRVYCNECKEALDVSALNGDLQCAVCQTPLPYDPSKWWIKL